MEDGQNQNNRLFRYRHNPPPIYAETAGAPDPNATPPCGGPFRVEPIDELLRQGTVAETFAFVFAPKGTGNLAQYYPPIMDSGSSWQDSSFWDQLASNTFSLEGHISEVQSMPMDQQSTQAINQMMPADMQVHYAPEESFSDSQQMDLLDVPSLNSSYSVFGTQFGGISVQEQANCGGNESGRTSMGGQVVGMENFYQQGDLDMSQVLQNNPAGFEVPDFFCLPSYNTSCTNVNEPVLDVGQMYQHSPWNISQSPQTRQDGLVAQNPSKRPRCDTEDSQWEDDTQSNPPSTNRHKSSMRRRSRPKASTARYQRIPSKIKSCTESQEPQAEYGVLYLGSEARESNRTSSTATVRTRPRKENACIGCKLNKRKCEEVELDNQSEEIKLDPRCSHCLKWGLQCMYKEFAFPMWSLSVSFKETRSGQPELVHDRLPNGALQSRRIFRANIYVSFGADKLGVPLRCKVSEIRSGIYHSPWSTSIEEDLPNARLDKNSIQKDRLRNYIIPDACRPSNELLVRWAIESIGKLPSDVVEDHYGPLYTFAATYVTIDTRPLYELVALTLAHTAIYNVGHSRMILVFDCKPLASHHLPKPLRDQLRKLLLQIFDITRENIRKRIVETEFRGQLEKERLAFYVVLSLLILTYEHILAETFMNPECLASLDPDFEIERAKFKDNLNDLQNLHLSVFKNTPNICHKGFDVSWKGDEDRNDDNELKEALLKLRTAVITRQTRKPSARSTVVQIPAPKLHMGLTSRQKDQESMSEIITVSTAKKLDHDNMSASTGHDTGNENSVPSVQQILEHIRQLQLR